MKEEHKRQGRRLLGPLVSLLGRAGVAPNAVTLAALPLSAGAAWLFAIGRFAWAGALAALVGLADTLDGELARTSGRKSRFGAVLDSTVDRLSEAMVLGGIAWYYWPARSLHGLLALVALVLSLMVSYVRARAEGAGFDCAVGWFERPVRVLVLLVGAFVLGRTWMPVALGVIALGSLVTVVQRLIHVGRQRA
ncbi:CDP-alcohol phosphatidyltransferase family protein [candidate division WOR-3 bacterium]|nr:CDP-alcohol phosphatidyltransferase family protein [candidate division WOR-3 bacterium]